VSLCTRKKPSALNINSRTAPRKPSGKAAGTNDFAVGDDEGHGSRIVLSVSDELNGLLVRGMLLLVQLKRGFDVLGTRSRFPSLRDLLPAR
jgi:hypothetical protein